jgi:dTDP-4-dehydrorhamnose 3,5-epimerase
MSNGDLIQGLLITPLRDIRDQRGAVLHMMRNDDPEFRSFGECYFSEVLPGAVKAWKRHRRQTQNLAVPVGRIRIVIYDGRKASPTYGKICELQLGRPDAYVRLRIPPEIWYGFQCISENPAMLANCSDLPHEPGESDVLPVGDPGIPYQWAQSGKDLEP